MFDTKICETLDHVRNAISDPPERGGFVSFRTNIPFEEVKPVLQGTGTILVLIYDATAKVSVYSLFHPDDRKEVQKMVRACFPNDKDTTIIDMPR